MIKANHKTFWIKFSNVYSRLLLKFFFRNIRYIGNYQPDGLPLLMISNHFSWWDGFIQIQLNNAFLNKRFHFMMLEKELRKSMILTNIGAFSIAKGKRSMVESIKYSLEILKDNKNMLLFFPQGRIQSLYTQNFAFELGVLSSLLKKAQKPYQLIFNINLIDYDAKRRPEISVYYKYYPVSETTTAEEIEMSFNEYARECRNEQCK